MQGWKTLIVAAIVGAAGALQAFDWATIIPQGQFWSGMAMTAIAALFAWLRTMTTTPVGK